MVRISNQNGIIVETRKIWFNGTYCAFTDLNFFEDKWYCVFREAADHATSDGIIRILSASDPAQWQTEDVLELKDFDLRDPRILIDFKNRLTIYTAVVDRATNKLENVYWTLINGKWKGPQYFNVNDYWLWRINLFNNELYSLAYKTDKVTKISELMLFQSNEASYPSFSQVGPVNCGQCPSEAALSWQKDSTIISIVRNDCNDHATYLGVARSPYTTFQWKRSSLKFDSPAFCEFRDTLYVAARVIDGAHTTEVYRVNKENLSLEKIVSLPSHGDNGYPGIYADKENIWVSYYSAETISRGNKRAIYLSRIQLP